MPWQWRCWLSGRSLQNPGRRRSDIHPGVGRALVTFLGRRDPIGQRRHDPPDRCQRELGLGQPRNRHDIARASAEWQMLSAPGGFTVVKREIRGERRSRSCGNYLSQFQF
jgi:hypothetical protein